MPQAVLFETELVSVGCAVFMFKLSWRLSMVTVIGLPVVKLVTTLYGQYYKVVFIQIIFRQALSLPFTRATLFDVHLSVTHRK